MTTQTAVADFLSQRSLAFIGVSRSENGFSRTAYKMLKQRGYRLFPVNPHADTIEDDKCHHSIREIPEQVDAAVIMVPPSQAESVIREVVDAGIRRVWIQQGAESVAAIEYCRQHGISVIHGQCILMFAEPVESFHKLHRWVWKLLGKMPAANGN